MVLTFSLIYMLGLAALTSCVCWLMLRSDHSAAAGYFMGNHLSLALWLISELLTMQAVNEHQMWLSYLIGDVGIAFIGSFWLMFSIAYSGREVPRRLSGVLFAASGLFYIAVFTNPRHRLYYTKFGIDGVSYGAFFYAGQVYIYSSMIIGIVIIWLVCFRDKSRSRGQAVLLSLATIIPLTLNVLTLCGIIKTRLALTPLSLTISAMLVLLATYRYDFLNVNAVAFEDAFNTIEEGLIVFNSRGRITYLSRAAKELLGVERTVLFGDIIKLMNGGEAAELQKDGRTISLRRYRCLDDDGSTLADLVICSDATHYYELVQRTEQLAEAERKLAVEKERSRIAQEVHDTAGHTLTMITSLARLAASSAEKLPQSADTAELLEYLHETESLSRSGVTQLRCSINDLRDDSFLRSVTGAVRMLCDSVRDMTAELTVQGTEDERYAPFIRLIYDNVRELITNCLRYSKADRMDIILRFSEEALELYVFDNGTGSGEIKEGNGLRGIRERTESAGGTVTFAADEGFRTIIRLPLNIHKSDEGVT
jgi:signal transduction histidine kinase